MWLRTEGDRHSWPAPDVERTTQSHLLMLTTFERTGTDSAHLAIFTTPESRFIDKSLWPLVARRRQWAVTGWPLLFRGKAYELIKEYDGRVMANLDALGANRVMRLSNFDLYRIAKSTVLERAYARVPVTRSIDLGSVSSDRHKLLGWGEPTWLKDVQVSASRLYGRAACAKAPCKTVLTKDNMLVKGDRQLASAQLMIRTERACDAAIMIVCEAPGMLALSINGFTVAQPAPSRALSAVIPRANIMAGVNVITLQDIGPVGQLKEVGLLGLRASSLAISRVEIDPRCDAAP